jgi:hypothetical protein
MTQIYFRCSNNGRTLPDGYTVAVEHLTEACELAVQIIRSHIKLPGPQDWRSFLLHVCDELGDELFVVPFAFVLGRPH